MCHMLRVLYESCSPEPVHLVCASLDNLPFQIELFNSDGFSSSQNIKDDAICVSLLLSQNLLSHHSTDHVFENPVHGSFYVRRKITAQTVHIRLLDFQFVSFFIATLSLPSKVVKAIRNYELFRAVQKNRNVMAMFSPLQIPYNKSAVQSSQNLYSKML
jgi:hypothetical protein